MISFGSDNHSGVHPLIMNALIETNENHEPSYGTDSLSQSLNQKIKNLIGDNHHWFHCFNGTAANVLSLKALTRSYETVFCTDISHLNLDECAAPEAFIGCKVKTLTHKDGKLNVHSLKKEMIRWGDQHHTQPGTVSLTQPTELGTCYSLKELQEISDFCKAHQLKLHIDGARLANACYTLEASLQDIVNLADAVSLGGTKNGLLGGELILLKKEFAASFKFIRKQAMQLPSKTRFSSIQFLKYFEDSLYLKISEHACKMAERLSTEIRKRTDITPIYPVQSNAVFIHIPQKIVKPLRKKYFFYVWDEHEFSIRLMTSFDTKEEDIIEFVNLLQELINGTE